MGEDIVKTIIDLVATHFERQQARKEGVELPKDTSLEDALASLSPESRAKMRATVDLSGDGKLGPIEYCIAFTESMKRQFRELHEQAKVKGSAGWQQLEDLKRATQENPHRITGEQFLSMYTNMGEKLFEGKFVPMNQKWADQQAEQYNEAIFVRANGVGVRNPFEVARRQAAAEATRPSGNDVAPGEAPIGNNVQPADNFDRSSTGLRK